MRAWVVLGGAIAWSACQETASTPPARTAQPLPPQTVPYPYPAPYGSPTAYAPPPPAPPGQPAPPQAPSPAVVATAGRPLLGPLFGPAAWQAEVRSVATELLTTLSPQNRARVASIPLVFDPNPGEVNAFAGCDDSGAPYVAGTEGLLEAVDAISQTKATDELYGTQTYEAYVSVIAPRILSKEGGSAMLPAGVIAPAYLADVRRISRAHEIFDEIVAFTFGHELSHHYLGHTGCANGQAGTLGPAIAQLGQMAIAVVPGINQPNESAADINGCWNTLDTGRARAVSAYRWGEEGGLWLLDFFGRLDRASGANPWLGFLRTHPNPALRIPVVQGTAATWRLQHPAP